MKIRIINIGKTKKDYISQAIQDYRGRISHYVCLEWLEIQSAQKTKSFTQDFCLKKESEKIRAQIRPENLKVILAEGGKEFSSLDFAHWIEGQMIQGINGIDFVLGGERGIDPLLIVDADLCLSLSKMTFTHQMVRVVLLEQIYRALTIIRGEPYHHG